jgi:hypothetical protein
VQDNVPIPPIKHNTPRKRKYPFEEMPVGGMFFVPGAKRASIGTHVSKVGKELGKKFSARACHMKRVKGSWEVCDPFDKSSVEGVGVWRTE